MCTWIWWGRYHHQGVLGTYLFTIIDRTTRWIEAIPLDKTSAADCAADLVAGWVARFGVPASLTSDRGPQFSGAIWGELFHA